MTETVSVASDVGVHLHEHGARLAFCGLAPQERLGLPVSAADCGICTNSNRYQAERRPTGHTTAKTPSVDGRPGRTR